ncbi:3-deoxy-manno-octulosonate cytidylyltransferase [bacterium]|nr:3-deoxy-manno-octulosonate cytidylyltransferase [bacterium]
MNKTPSPHTPSGSAPVKVVIAIPARLGSTRLPRKPLALLSGRPMVVRVAERVEACAQKLCEQLQIARREIVTLVATDSSEVVDALQSTNIQTVLTPSHLPSGTDRIYAAVHSLISAGVTLLPSTLIINLQGDEPFFSEDDVIHLVSAMLAASNTPMGTLAFPQSSPTLFVRTSVVKVVCNTQGNALYFSRAPIAWPREKLGASEAVTGLAEKLQEQSEIPFLQHVGIYAYRFDALQNFTNMPPSSLELAEGLEQLRALEAGWKVRVIHASEPPFGIDTAEDLQRAEQHLSKTGVS